MEKTVTCPLCGGKGTTPIMLSEHNIIGWIEKECRLCNGEKVIDIKGVRDV